MSFKLITIAAGGLRRGGNRRVDASKQNLCPSYILFSEEGALATLLTLHFKLDTEGNGVGQDLKPSRHHPGFCEARLHQLTLLFNKRGTKNKCKNVIYCEDLFHLLRRTVCKVSYKVT